MGKKVYNLLTSLQHLLTSLQFLLTSLQHFLTPLQHLLPPLYFTSTSFFILNCTGWAATYHQTEFLMDHACTFSPSCRAVTISLYLIFSTSIEFKMNKYYNNKFTIPNILMLLKSLIQSEHNLEEKM